MHDDIRSKLSLNRTLILVFISFSLSAQSKQSARFGLKDSVIEPQRVRNKSADESVWICANGGHSSRPTNDGETSSNRSTAITPQGQTYEHMRHNKTQTARNKTSHKPQKQHYCYGHRRAAAKTGNFPDATSQRRYFCISEKLL